MKTALLTCILAQICLVLRTATEDAIESPVDFNLGDTCAHLCNFYEDICLSDWVDPKNNFSPHCTGLSDVKRAPVHCQLCLKINGVPPKKDRKAQKPRTNSSDNSTCNCDGPCGCVCNCYENACMPTQLDPEGYFKSHCAGLKDEKYPSPWCVECLLKNGTSSLGNCETTTTPQSTSTKTPSTKSVESTISTTTDNTQPTTLTTQSPQLQRTRLTTTPKVPTNCARPSCSPDSCLAFCNFYDKVCVPSGYDPCFHYYPHCELNVTDYHRATDHCLNCLQIHGVCPNPNVLAVPQTTQTSPLLAVTTQQIDTTTCTVPSSCDKPFPTTPDPCRSFCDNYTQVCIPPEMDTCFHFYPHCIDTIEGYNLPSERCLKCICVHGLRPNTKDLTKLSNTSPVPKPTVTPPWECWCSRTLTTVTEAPIKKCPAKSRDCVFPLEGGETTESWACSCGTYNSAKKRNKPVFFGDGGSENCPEGTKGQCTCKRTKKVTRQVKIKSCEGFELDRSLCNVDSPTASEQTTVSTECNCKNCQKSKGNDLFDKDDDYYNSYGDYDEEDDDDDDDEDEDDDE